jgi:hypothetical protein
MMFSLSYSEINSLVSVKLINVFIKSAIDFGLYLRITYITAEY